MSSDQSGRRPSAVAKALADGPGGDSSAGSAAVRRVEAGGRLQPPAAAPRSVDGRRVVMISLIAAVVLALVHFLPRAAGLAPADFVAGGPNSLEFCDPANPRFLAVATRESPVTMAIEAAPSPAPGRKAELRLTLRTSTGKPIGPDDLLSTAGARLNLLIVDPALEDFHHPEARPGAGPGTWLFFFVPRGGGPYRVFADFTPAATEREMYASADLPVNGTRLGSDLNRRSALAVRPGAAAARDGYRFTLGPSISPVYARQPLVLVFRAERIGGGMVPLLPVRGAFVHLVAFDQARTGFVNLRADKDNGGAPRPPDPFRPEISFRVTFSDPGQYVLWSWFNLAGREVAVAFGFEIRP